MRIGVPIEVKADEKRVALTPANVRELVGAGHRVVIQARAGSAAGFADDEYREVGGEIAGDASSVFGVADLIVKVKEPQPQEVELLRQGQVLFTYLHLAADAALTRGLVDSGATCIAYETIEDGRGVLPLLAPMSEIAGTLAAHAGAFALRATEGGRGILLGRIPGAERAEVLVVGGGVAGGKAAATAAEMGAWVWVLDRDPERLRELEARLTDPCTTRPSSQAVIEELLPRADVVIGAVLVTGARTPHLVSRPQLSEMKPGAAVIDVSIDQGGCFETSSPTTHSRPTYVVDQVVHYCVANMPAAVPRTATEALTNATLPYIARLADRGLAGFVSDGSCRSGVNVHDGMVTHRAVADAAGLRFGELGL